MGEELFTMQNGRELGIEYYRESARLEDEEYVARKQEAALVAEEAVEVLAVGRRARSVG